MGLAWEECGKNMGPVCQRFFASLISHQDIWCTCSHFMSTMHHVLTLSVYNSWALCTMYSRWVCTIPEHYAPCTHVECVQFLSTMHHVLTLSVYNSWALCTMYSRWVCTIPEHYAPCTHVECVQFLSTMHHVLTLSVYNSWALCTMYSRWVCTIPVLPGQMLLQEPQ